MEPEKKDTIDLSNFSKREELEKVAQICDKLNNLFEKSTQTVDQEQANMYSTQVSSNELKLKKKQ